MHFELVVFDIAGATIVNDDHVVREVPGASRAFRRLHEMGVLIALDTGFRRPIADAILARVGWMDAGLVDACVTSDEVLRGRPAPDMIREAMRRTRVRDVSRVVKVGDTPSDLQEGAAAGCAVVVGITTHGEEELRRHPCTHVLPSIALMPELLTRIEARPPASLAFAWALA